MIMMPMVCPGGFKKSDTFMEAAAKFLVDAMHAWHSTDSEALKVNSAVGYLYFISNVHGIDTLVVMLVMQVDNWTVSIRGMHIYDSMVFLDKVSGR